jgi:hypothetical protein
MSIELRAKLHELRKSHLNMVGEQGCSEGGVAGCGTSPPHKFGRFVGNAGNMQGKTVGKTRKMIFGRYIY